MLSDQLSGAPLLHARGKAWSILFDHATLLEIERITGLNVLVGEADLLRASLKLLRAALFATLVRAGCSLTLEEAGSLLTPGRLAAIQTTLVRAWVASMPEQEQLPVDLAAVPPEPMKLMECWSIARFDLRLTDAEWLAMTPRMVAALRQRELEAIRRSEIRTGILASTVQNCSTVRPRTPARAEDFMLHPYPRKPVVLDADYLLRAFARIPKTEGSYETH